jgi:hypothetical protein
MKVNYPQLSQGDFLPIELKVLFVFPEGLNNLFEQTFLLYWRVDLNSFIR